MRSFNAKDTGRSVFSCVALHKQAAGLKSCFLCKKTVFLCVGDSLEKTSWGLRKREASKQEDRGCAPPHSIFPPCPQWMQQHKPLWHLRKLIFAKGSNHDAILWCGYHQLQRADNVAFRDATCRTRFHWRSVNCRKEVRSKKKRRSGLWLRWDRNVVCSRWLWGHSGEAGCNTYHLNCKPFRRFPENKLRAKRFWGSCWKQENEACLWRCYTPSLNSSLMLDRSRSSLSGWVWLKPEKVTK